MVGASEAMTPPTEQREKIMSTTMNKAYNATREGQMAMAYDAASRAPAFQMNSIIKAKGGIGWPDDMIASADPVMLRSIKDDLLEEYNSLVTPKVTKQQ